MLDVESLSAPLSGDAACGLDLETDAEFQALEWAARGTATRGGDPDAEPPEPDWADVRGRALALFERTRDLRVAALLTQALTATEGMAGLAQGLALLQRLCERHWDTLHPVPDAADGNDPVMRMNALALLAHPEGIPKTLRASRWIAPPGIGAITVRTAEIVLGLLPMPEENGPDLTVEQLRGLLLEEAGRGLADHAGAALQSIAALQALLAERVGAGQATDLRPLVQRIRPLANLFAQALAQSGGAEAAQHDAPAEGADTAAAAAPRRGAPGSIASRQDAHDALERVCRWLEQNEPSNPAPLLIRRAQKLMSMRFIDIVKELSPEGMASIAKIAGLPEGE